MQTLTLHRPAQPSGDPATVRDLMAVQDNVRAVVDPLVTSMDAVQGELGAVQNLAPFAGLIKGLVPANGTGNLVTTTAGAVIHTDGTVLSFPAWSGTPDTAWAQGFGQGKLDAGSVGNVTYHRWPIYRRADGALDVIDSISAVAAGVAIPGGGWEIVPQCIFSFPRMAGAVVAFVAREIEGGGLEVLMTAPFQTAAKVWGGVEDTEVTIVGTGVPFRKNSVLRIGAVFRDASPAAPTYIIMVSKPGPLADVVPTATINTFEISANASGAIPQTVGGIVTITSGGSSEFAIRLTGSTADHSANFTLFGWIDARRS